MGWRWSWRERIRFGLVPFGLACWFVLLIFRLFSLHLGDHPTVNDSSYHKSFPAVRGIIFDRGENPIAVNQPGYRIYLDPRGPVNEKKGQSKEKTARRVSQLTGKSYGDVYGIITGDSRNRYIVQGVTFDPSALDLRTNDHAYCCVGIEPIMHRHYPQGRSFSHILGFVSGQDQIGRNGGVEQRANSYLHGTAGFYDSHCTRGRAEIRERRISTVDPINGASVYLTIDQNLQKSLVDTLYEAVTNAHALGGRAIIQLVDTGEILAMASIPDFDPAAYQEYTGKARRNRTIGEIYDPGSTMKSIVVAAGLNEGFITPDSTYDVGNRSWYYGGHVLHDHAQGIIDIRTIIKKSSNIGAAKIGLDLGNKRLESYLRAFGFGKRTGIDLPGEERGILVPHERWDKVKPTRISIGQGISVTPMQMLNAYCTIANGGRLMRPYVISRIVSPSGEMLFRNEPKVQGRPISPEVAADMRSMLQSVTEMGGTARRAAVCGYSVAGKTGTAQMTTKDPKTGRWGYSHTDYWASFAGFVPADHPVFGVIVVIDRPRGYHTGGVVAAPVFSKVAAFTAQYMEIPIEVKGESAE